MSDDQGAQLIDQAFEAFHRDDREASLQAAEAALALARDRDDPRLELDALIAHARLALRALDFPAMEQHCRDAMAAAERTGDPRSRVMPLHMRAEATRLQGDTAAARALYDESIALNRSLGEEGMVGVELHNIAYVDKADGDYDTAQERFLEALAITRRRTGGMVVPCLLGLGAVAACRGDGVRAGRLIAAAEAAMAAAGEVPDPADEPELRDAVRRARELLGADADRVWAEGAALTLDEAVAEATGA